MDMKDKVKAAANAAALALLADYACRMSENHGAQCGEDCDECRREVVEENTDALAGILAEHMERLLLETLREEETVRRNVGSGTLVLAQNEVEAMLGLRSADARGTLYDDKPEPAKTPLGFKIGDIVSLLPYPDIKAVVRGIKHCFSSGPFSQT